VRIGHGNWATGIRANGLAEGTKLRSRVKRIRAVTRVDLVQEDQEGEEASAESPERESIVGGGQQPSPLRLSKASVSGVSGGAPNSSECGGCLEESFNRRFQRGSGVVGNRRR